jgi:hypothetical protein
MASSSSIRAQTASEHDAAGAVDGEQQQHKALRQQAGTTRGRAGERRTASSSRARAGRPTVDDEQWQGARRQVVDGEQRHGTRRQMARAGESMARRPSSSSTRTQLASRHDAMEHAGSGRRAAAGVGARSDRARADAERQRHAGGRRVGTTRRCARVNGGHGATADNEPHWHVGRGTIAHRYTTNGE